MSRSHDAERERAAPGAERGAEADAEPAASILIVEDHPEQREVLFEILRSQGYVMHAAPDGESGVDAARRLTPDVVLLDVELPGMDGFETCRRLQLLERPPQVIFLSAHSSVPLAVQGLDAGGVDYVTKPIETENLLARLRAAVRTKRSLDALATRVSHDPLTGLLVRAELPPRAEALLGIAGRHGRVFACLMLDIDRFKQVNDRLGHPAGDRVLQVVAARLADTVRAADAVFRVGGEEFVVLAPESDLPAGRALGERLRAAVAARPVELDGTAGELPELGVTVSVGVTAWRRGADLEALLTAADSALYAAKHAGRDTVRTAEPEVGAPRATAAGTRQAPGG